MWLRGRCRRCGAPIGRRTLVMEAGTPVVFLGILAIWGWGPLSLAAWLATSWSEVALAMGWERRVPPGGFWPLGAALWAGVAGVAWLGGA
jgi:prepilin signal peptidase PulO-like enzyme (type II secretory pathway)